MSFNHAIRVLTVKAKGPLITRIAKSVTLDITVQRKSLQNLKAHVTVAITAQRDRAVLMKL
jgi:hypothetical protein